MKKRIIINESERQEILSKHSEFGYKTINEQSVQDIQNKLNKDFGSNIEPDNKFGPDTAKAIINALDKIKSGTVTPSQGTTTQSATTQGATTQSATTQADTTQGATTQADTTQGATTQGTTTQGTTTQGTTQSTTTQGDTGSTGDGKDSTHKD